MLFQREANVSSGPDGRPTPLRELRVVEISDRIAGSYCGKLLLDAGAEVCKIEPPQGDWLRQYSASCSPVPDGDSSPFYSYLNAGKRSMTFGSGAEDQAQLRDLLAAADVVIVTANRSQAAALGIDPKRLLADSPQAVIVTISDFGWTGPYADRAASEFTLQAWAGSPGFRGNPAGPPIAIGGDLGEYMGGVFAAFGALAMRRRVEHGGSGEHLDLSMLEAITTMQSSEWLHSQLLRVPPVRRTLEVPSIEPAKDGYVGITMVTGQQWLDFVAMVESHSSGRSNSCNFRSADGTTATSSGSRSVPGWPKEPSRRSSSSVNYSGCRSRRWATAPPSDTWSTRPSARCSSATLPVFISPVRPG